MHIAEGVDVRIVVNRFLYREGKGIFHVSHISYEDALSIHRGEHGYHGLPVDIFALEICQVCLGNVFEHDLIVLVDSHVF